MRKLCFVLTALLLTTPAFAGVVISCAQVTDTNQVQVSYTASDDANIPRAFGLNITLVGVDGLTIDDIVSGSESEDYWVYPGTIVISGGAVTNQGTPRAPIGAAGECSGEGECMTIEMGSLYDELDPEHQDKPGLTGPLFKFSIDGSGDCNVVISGNSARGNVVLEDTEQADDVTYGTCLVSIIGGDCYTGQADYAEFEAVGKPTCWCFKRQCYGDADDLSEGKGSYWVFTADLDLMLAAWSKTAGTLTGNEACSDVDHLSEGKGSYRVFTGDLDILLANWGTNDVPDDCAPGNMP
jgi:hypothetical protein